MSLSADLSNANTDAQMLLAPDTAVISQTEGEAFDCKVHSHSSAQLNADRFTDINYIKTLC